MDGSSQSSLWLRSVLLRALLVGLSIGVAGVAGSSLVFAQTASGSVNATVVVVTVLLALGIGLWAGSPDATVEEIRLRERWVSAAAVFAVAGAFATFSSLYQQMFPGPWWGVGSLLLALAVPCYAAGLLLPLLLTWAERWLEHDGGEDGGFGGFGPVVLGVLAGAAVGALLTGFVVLPRWSAAAELMVVSLLLLLPATSKDPSIQPARQAQVFRAVTPYGTLEVTDLAFPGERQPERRLYLNGEEESGQLVRSGAPTLAYIAAAEHWLSQITPAGSSYLFLGGGAYTLPRRIAERDSRARITVVELDPEITRIAYRYFGVKPNQSIASVHGDGRAYLSSGTAEVFDRIYVDVYGGREALPHSLVTKEAAEAIARRLTARGIAALNVIGTVGGEESRQLWSVVRTFAEVFPNIAVYSHLGPDFPDRQNLLLAIAVDGDTRFPDRAGFFDLWKREAWPVGQGTTVFRDLATPREVAGERVARQISS